MRIKHACIATTAALAAAGAIAASALGADSTETTLQITLGKPSELKLTAPTRAKAGKITFIVTNKGTLPHEMVVVPLPPGKTALPVKGSRASEKGSLGEAPEMGKGRTKSVTLELKPGRYQLICNVAGHYQGGMFKNLIVA
jgi:uncharacterized cupredoxin-like copper-binding protein